MDLNVITIIIEVASFLILMGLLTRLLYRPLLSFLDKRAQAISRMGQEAKEDREASQRELDQSKEELHKAKLEALGMRETTKVEAEGIRQKVLKEAKQQADAMVERSKGEIQKETEKAKLEIKKELADLSIRVAEKILMRRIKKEDQERLVQNSIKEMPGE